MQMQSLHRMAVWTLRRRIPVLPKFILNSFSTKNPDDEWNDAWETAWLPEELTAKNRDPWEADVNYPSPNSPEVDLETKAFVEEMNDNWDQRRKAANTNQPETKGTENGTSLYSLENVKKDYRLKKQRIHAGLWMKEIEKQQEAKLGGSADDIDRLLDTCSEYASSLYSISITHYVLVWIHIALMPLEQIFA